MNICILRNMIISGKYGYYDPEGVLREASYGAEAGRGFEPEIR